MDCLAKQIINKKYKAGALLYVIAIGFFICIICSLLILIKLYGAEIIAKQVNQDIALNNCNSALELIKSGNIKFEDKKKIAVDLYGDKIDSVYIDLLEWGVYEIAIIKSRYLNSEYSKIVEFGDHCIKDRTSIFLENNAQYLGLSGNTIISGDCIVPNGKINKVFFNGIPYNNNNKEVSNGNIVVKSMPFPILVNPTNKNLEIFDLTKAILFSQNKTNQISNSFLDKTLMYYENGPLFVSDRSISGNVILYSFSEITVSKSSNLMNVILIAPKITIEDGFIGNLQCFATDSINIGNSVDLRYPSILMLNPVKSKEKGIKIGNNSRILGTLMLNQNSSDEHISNSIYMGNGVFVLGNIICYGSIEFNGKIIGSLFTKGLIKRLPTGIYENTLYNDTIDSYNLPSIFVDGCIVEGEFTKGFIQCLN